MVRSCFFWRKELLLQPLLKNWAEPPINHHLDHREEHKKADCATCNVLQFEWNNNKCINNHQVSKNVKGQLFQTEVEILKGRQKAVIFSHHPYLDKM